MAMLAAPPLFLAEAAASYYVHGPLPFQLDNRRSLSKLDWISMTNEDPDNKDSNKMAPNEATSDAGQGQANEKESNPLQETNEARAHVVKNNDVEMGVTIKSGSQNDYPALTKAELMQYATDPFWVRLRWILFVLFWVAWIAMLVVAVAIIVMAPKCPSPEPKEWWQKGAVYEVYVKSFKDSNADGIGDLKGIESKVDYLKALGVGSVWLSPIYKSPQKDNGYDISDYKTIDPMFGNMKDFEDLVNVLHDNDIKVIMDYVPNHSSDQHEWFKKSVKREDPYTDYYIWLDGKPGAPPNNWKSVFGGSAWTFNNERGQYYLHQFYKEQPDLNVRNPLVVTELEDILRFWMDKGVDGFRMDAVAHLFEDENFADEGIVPGKTGYESVDHTKTYNLPEVLDLLKKFRKVLDTKTIEDEYNPRIMMTEAYLPINKLVEYYGKDFNHSTHSGDISHMPLNLAFLEAFMTESDVTPSKVRETIQNYLSALPHRKAWPNFNLGNHDKPRIATRVGHELVDAMNMILMLLPGTPITYYGEEIGMTDISIAKLSPDKQKDTRNMCRTPMQWTDGSYAGFTSGSAPWLPVNDDFEIINVQSQQKEPSHLDVYKKLSEIRHHQSILFGKTDFYSTDSLFSFARVRKGNPGYLVAINLGEETLHANVTNLPNLPPSGTVHVRSFHSKREDPGTIEGKPYDPEALWSKIWFDRLTLLPKEGIVVTYVPQF